MFAHLFVHQQKSTHKIIVSASFSVTPPGFKPGTPTSVVWYSIQLSYGAVKRVQIYNFIYFGNRIKVIFAIIFENQLMNNNEFLAHIPAMANELPFAITVCDANAIILYMNERSISTFQKYGGAEIIGTSLFLYHHGPASDKLRELLDTATKNAYTIEKNGIKKLVYQSPWYKDGKFAGLIELSLEIPMVMEHFVRS